MNKSNIYFSIVMPVYNTDLVLLNKCLSSILNQNFPSFEVIIIDGGSSTPVIDLLKTFTLKDGRFKLLSSSKGVSKQRNLGLKKASGKYVIFIDSDDYISENFLLEIYKTCLEKSPDIAIPNIKCTRLIDGKFKIVYSYDQYKEQNSLITDINFFEKIKEHGLAFVFRAYKKEILCNCNFDENLSFGEDMFFNFTLSKSRGLKLSKVEDAVYYYNRPLNKNLLTDRINERTLVYFDKIIELIKIYKRYPKNRNGLIYQYEYSFKAFYYECLKFNNKKMIRRILKYRLYYLKINFSLRNLFYIFCPSLFKKIKKYN